MVWIILIVADCVTNVVKIKLHHALEIIALYLTIVMSVTLVFDTVIITIPKNIFYESYTLRL